jgi:hypothetical protein
LPYHAAERLPPQDASHLVARGVAMAQRIAVREMRAAVERERARENDVIACAVLVGAPMPDWSTAEIVAVHFRMHQAEGVLFKDALMRAATSLDVRAVRVPQNPLAWHWSRSAGCLWRSAAVTAFLTGSLALALIAHPPEMFVASVMLFWLACAYRLRRSEPTVR